MDLDSDEEYSMSSCLEEIIFDYVIIFILNLLKYSLYCNFVDMLDQYLITILLSKVWLKDPAMFLAFKGKMEVDIVKRGFNYLVASWGSIGRCI